LTRLFGFVSADQMRDGRRSGATPAARVDLRNVRRVGVCMGRMEFER
jgi:hypothetical protein